MNYELAKQLKDAGFPQDECCVHGKSGHDHVFEPSLSELIEACGDEFHGLWRVMDEWFAKDARGLEIKGSTPEEAVAKLWLALNKPNA